MAALEREECPYCAKDLTLKNERSRSTHVGICRVKFVHIQRKQESREICRKQQEKQDQQGGSGDEEQQAVPSDGELSAEEPQQQDVLALRTSDEPVGFNLSGVFGPFSAHASATDVAWLKTYFERRDLSSSLLDAVFPLCGMAPISNFTSAQSLFAFVDALPGPEFHVTSVRLPGIPEPFDFAYREITDVVVDLIRQHNGTFLNPSAPRDTSTFEGEYTHGSRFRELQEQLSAVAGPRAVLMPVILNSGKDLLRLLLFCFLPLLLLLLLLLLFSSFFFFFFFFFYFFLFRLTCHLVFHARCSVRMVHRFP